MSPKLRLGVLISGRGSNLQALIDACADPAFPATIVLVISNVPGAAGLARARQADIPTEVIDHKAFPDRATFDAALDTALRDADVELVCLAGFMRLLTDGFVEAWRDRMINIHPSLLPSFKGLDTHRRMLELGVKIGGCTVHYVRPDMDTGPIIVQAAVPVLPDDDPERLAARILEKEHVAYPLAVRLIAEGRVRLEGDRAWIEDGATSAGALLTPATNDRGRLPNRVPRCTKSPEVATAEDAMAVEMEHERAPKENLETWNIVIKLLNYSAIGVAITLILMAAFLL